VRRILTVVIAVLTVSVAACGTERGNGPTPAVPGGPPEVHDAWTSCDANAPKPVMGPGNDDVVALPRLAADFAPVAVIICGNAPEQLADGSTALMETERRADDVAELVAALRLPDQPRTAGACTADLPMVPWFAMLDAQGRWVHPGTPVDVCGKIRIEVRNAVQNLKLTTVTSKKAGEIESKEAAAAGCSQVHADMVWVETTMGSSAKLAPVGKLPYASAKQVRLCVYAVPPSQQRSGKPGGNFEYGLVLPDARRTAIDQALLAAPAAKNCAEPASRFALLRSADDRSGEVYVELDACQRILATPTEGGHSLAQSNPALVDMLGKD
jgi:hypothetical protein